MAYSNASTTALVKGGMPVLVEGTYNSDESGADVTDVTVMWASSGKPVTPAFLKSLSSKDWDAIADAIAEAA